MLMFKIYKEEYCDQMEHSMDPYEQQLLSVFNSYDLSHRGSLDQEGLLQLCNSLQLEEQGVELIKCLLSDSKSHVTFNEFKDGLLTLLGSVQNRQKLDFNAPSDSESESPDREVSPKFVYGSKKYGRRSRPDSTEEIELCNDRNTENEKYENKPIKNFNKVQRSNSQNDVTHSRKRKTSKLKRCTSFPGNREMEHHFKSWNQETAKKPQNIEQNQNSLYSVLDQLGIRTDGYLNQPEIVRVCEFMGKYKLAKNCNHEASNKNVSIEELMDILHKDNCGYETPQHELSNCIAEDSLFNNKSLQYITLGPNGTGVITSQAVVELWENAGIPSAAALLQELGLTNSTIGVVDLAAILEDELRSLNESRTDVFNVNPHVVLLQATIALYQSEVKYLKSVLEQLIAERDKLRVDITDANQRASLLAQEVDDNHAKMEKSTQNQVRLIEQRHSDILKDLASQYAGEKEQLTLMNNKMEEKIISLETEEAKLRSDLSAIQKYSNVLEKENNLLSSQLSEANLVRSSLTERVNILEAECQKMSEIERERDQLEPLFEKLSLLQCENAELRDKNDELCTEVETLNSEISVMRTKMSSTPTFGFGDENCESVGLGAIKRRVDSPKNENNMEIESPRLGKMRRCYNKNQPEVLLDALGTQLPFNSSESGFEAELDCLDSSLSFTGSEGCSSYEISQLQARISYLEQLLLQNSIKFPKNADDSVSDIQTKTQLVKRCKELEKVLEEVRAYITDILKNSDGLTVSQLGNKLKTIVFENSSKSNEMNPTKVDSSTETENYTEIEKQLQEKIEENAELTERCENLDQALDMLRNEFENCEIYWSNKLDEERQIFDQEQKQNSEKLSELLVKIAEYEDQFANSGRLSPIDEKGNLEQQFTELEEEYNTFQTQMEVKISLKDKEIAILQQKLSEVKKISCDIAVQVDFPEKIIPLESKVNHLSHVVESTNIFSSETMPNVWQYSNSNPPDPSSKNQDDSSLWQKSSSDRQESSSSVSNSDTNSLLSVKLENETCSLPPTISWQPLITVTSPQPHSLNYIPDNSVLQNSCRPKRTRKHDKSFFATQLRIQKKDNEMHRHFDGGNPLNGQFRRNVLQNDQTCVVPLSSIHHLHGRLRELDQHCRHLQFILKQQQRHSESVMHHCWQQHRDEVNDLQIQIKCLQDKLARSDMLIKDLYVENTYLMANNQRLEHRCHMLAQCNTESTSV